MSDDANRWKEKYLKSIEQQEKLERRWAARLDLLRRGLVRSTLAAEGTDRAVDQCMKEMREVVRTDDMDAGLAALLPRLEKAVLDSEQRRETRVEQISSALTALVSQLQSLPLPREVSRPLKAFAKQLDGRVGQAREIPLLLGELSSLQGKALSQLETPAEPDRPSLLQRLFGSREASETPAPAEEAVATNPPLPAAAAEAHPQAEEAPAPEDGAREHYQTPTQALPEAVSAPAAPAPAQPEVQLEPEPVAQPVASDEPEVAAVPAPAPVVAFVPPVLVQEAPAEPVPAIEVEPQATISPVAEPQAPVDPGVVAASDSPPAPVAEAAFNPDELLPLPTVSPAVLLDSLPLPAVMAEALAAIDPEQSEHDVLYALPDSPEPSYSSVAKHIEHTLLGLLDDLSLPERHRPQAEAMRDRLQHGLNWYELLPILDDLAVLMLAITDSGQHEFETYLKQLNERLEAFQSNLQAASDGHADSSSAARAMDSQIREQVDGLQSSVQEAADLDDLKQVLESHLEGLLGTMDHHQKQRDEREREVAARLQSLAERVSSMEQEAQGYREHLEEQRQKALIDPLTGLPNRAAWSERLEHEVGQWQQHGNSLLLAMLDLDHFKRINDNYGHLAGDKVLKIIANVLRKRLRGSDFIARFGGEEFVLLLPNTPWPVGVRIVEALRAAIEACPFHFKGEPVTITVSVGLSAFKAGDRSDLVIKRADQALYRAKDAGRNRVEAG
ncbi:MULTISPECIES: GGDEF domain-containing protein [unclassified Pseudomonas]|uniref:GGDEF domain-containing protein n=1 Tax=unclassified Pseudomonas TaxID=196821 RepID=UPI000876EA66|nr:MULTISPECIES: GGDEF domain-containing protein [unclassified Pseudomonas]SCZ69373.1 diguanylate cyclase [Pseudomonas sp. NFPP17]SDA70220.1 diguanylate cyclase [Pseudomonas sp. NFPP15]SEL41410.1 diguanylate cyclase [Pseudomonas sp. NFPP18]SFA62995.1 diguanylate cyclase [Pseudomonas sp. NFPP13]SFT86307.1 diguanylate cyclase [Pseudomonas sp. NFPP25]